MILRVLALLCLLVLTAGCDGTHLAGTHDVELDYEVRVSSAAPAESARHAVETRLGAAHVPADVETNGPAHLRVVVDEDSAESVDEMLMWRGGLAVYETAPSYAFTPRDATGLTAKTETAKDGTIERYFVGPHERALHAINEGNVDAQHRVLLEAADGGLVRTRAVVEPAAIELKDFVDFDTAVESEKRDLVLYVKDAARLREKLAAIGAGPTVIALGRTVMAKKPLGALLEDAHGPSGRPALVLHMGDGIQAFSRAHNVRTLLRSGIVPPLARTSARELEVHWPLAIGCLLVPMILSAAWLFFVRRFDRAYPEPCGSSS